MLRPYGLIFYVNHIRKTDDHSPNYLCLDCGVNTSLIRQYYMVHKELWLQAVPEVKGMLCIPCLSKRLGRELAKDDFTSVPVNEEFFQWNPDLSLIHSHPSPYAKNIMDVIRWIEIPKEGEYKILDEFREEIGELRKQDAERLKT